MTAAKTQTRDDGAGVIVVGLGRTGLSCARHLAAAGVPVSVVDTRPAPPGLAALRAELPDVPVQLGPFDAGRFAAAGRLVVSPGVPVSDPAIRAALRAGVEVLGDVELFAREAAAPIAAVTGSNGKSTVTALLGDIARESGRRAQVGGNIGTPVLELLGAGGTDLYVVELSSFQLETTSSLAPAAAAVLNVSPDHLDRYPDLDAYVAAKARILAGARAAVLNLDDPIVAALATRGARVLGFSVAGAASAHAALVRRRGEEWLALGGEAIAPASSMPLAGRHNLANALAAMALADALGLERAAMARAIGRFRGLAHRCALVAEHAGVRWIDDSKGTNVGATVAAIEGIARGRDVVLIAGGEGKGQDFSPLAAPVARHVHTIVLIGRDAALIEHALAPGARCLHARDMVEAVAAAGGAAAPGDCVLLSPACASFDMFDGYAARGDAFAAAVLRRIGR